MKRMLFAALLIASSPAFAGGYFGLGANRNTADTDLQDDTSTSATVFGGWQISPNFGLEAGYTDLGNFFVINDGNFMDKVEASALYAAVVGKFAVSQSISLFAKAGMAQWDISNELSQKSYTTDAKGNVITDYALLASADSDGTDPVASVGVEAALGGGVSLRGEFTRFMDVGDVDIDSTSLSAVLRF